jgi:hypothetical protein
VTHKLPDQVERLLRTASQAPLSQSFTCQVFKDGSWNTFVELWAPRIYSFVRTALGPYAVNPHAFIEPIEDAFHIAGANASFSPGTGQICLATHMEGNPGVTLEKLTHEMIHASLAAFPDGDPFYEEGVADYTTWVMAHAECWDPYRDEMIKAAADNIRNRRERAMRTDSDYDKKRWAGGLYMSTAYGPYVVVRYRQRKLDNNLTW